MAWQRKTPFGYRIQNGLIQTHPLETDAVRAIFQRYLAGASLLTIAEEMTRQGIRYHQRSAAWNKSMVKRILENERYTGTDGCPQLVSDKDFTAVQAQRRARNTYASLPDQVWPLCDRLVCAKCGGRLVRGSRSHGRVHWRCQNEDCGERFAIRDEVLTGLVDRRLRELAQAPHLLTAPEPAPVPPDMEAVRLQNELTLAHNRGDESIPYIKTLALAVAAQQYSRLPDPTPAHDLEQLRARLVQGSADDSILTELLRTAVKAIRLGPDQTVTLELINGKTIHEEVQSE